jgi:hypothetical protein
MNVNLQTVLASVTASAVTSGVVLAGFVNLQDTTPGTPQAGNINIIGTLRAGNAGIGAPPGANRLQVTGSGTQGGVRVNTQDGTGFTVTSNLTGANFMTTAPAGRGVVGDSQASTGNGFGGVFATRTTGGGAGAFARAIGTNNTSTGLIAENTAATGKALLARNTANNNTLEAGTANDSLLTNGKLPRHTYATGTPAAMVPIAYGTIDGFAGVIITGSGNFTVTRVAAGRYDIDVLGVSLPYSSLVAIATAEESDGSEFCSYTAPATGEVRFQVFDAISNALNDSNFAFVIYRVAGILSPPAGLVTPNMGSAKDFESWQRQDPAAFDKFRRAYQDWEREALATQPTSLPTSP